MNIVIAGGHGQIARILTELCIARGEQIRSIIRDPDHAEELSGLGAEPIVLDLEQATPAEVAQTVTGADAMVFAAGAGPGSGIDRKDTVDRGASDLCVAAAEAAGVDRFLQISAMGTDRPPQDDSVFSHYLRAKAAAEQTLTRSSLNWTILRPGRLTNDSPDGRVELGAHVSRGQISRADVAELIVALLGSADAVGSALEVVGGPTPIPEAVAALAAR